MILVKPRQRAIAKQKKVQAKIDGFVAETYAMFGTVRLNEAQKLKADSEASLKVGDYKAAMGERLEILEWKNLKITNLTTLSFYGIQSMALKDIGRIASRLDADTARGFAAQLESQDTKLFTYKQILVNQKAEELKQVDDASKTPKNWQITINGLGFTPQEKTVLRQTSTAQVKINIADYYNQLIQGADKPYNSVAQKPTVALDTYSKNYATSYAASRFLWAKAKTQRLLVVAALRARADRLENKLANAPLPLDPFSAGRFQRKGHTVYSVGPDGINNSGAPVANPITFQATDKGDILAPVF